MKLSQDDQVKCLDVLKELKKDPNYELFSRPVLPDLEPALAAEYSSIVKNPMDLGTVEKRISSAYSSIAEFEDEGLILFIRF